LREIGEQDYLERTHFLVAITRRATSWGAGGIHDPSQRWNVNFENVPAGRYSVHVRDGPSGQYYLKALRYGGTESASPAFFFPGTAGLVELTLSAHGALVSGVVKRKAAGSTTTQVVLLPDTSDAELKLYGTHPSTMLLREELFTAGPVPSGVDCVMEPGKVMTEA